MSNGKWADQASDWLFLRFTDPRCGVDELWGWQSLLNRGHFYQTFYRFCKKTTNLKTKLGTIENEVLKMSWAGKKGVTIVAAN